LTLASKIMTLAKKTVALARKVTLTSKIVTVANKLGSYTSCCARRLLSTTNMNYTEMYNLSRPT